MIVYKSLVGDFVFDRYVGVKLFFSEEVWLFCVDNVCCKGFIKILMEWNVVCEGFCCGLFVLLFLFIWFMNLVFVKFLNVYDKR